MSHVNNINIRQNAETQDKGRGREVTEASEHK